MNYFTNFRLEKQKLNAYPQWSRMRQIVNRKYLFYLFIVLNAIVLSFDFSYATVSEAELFVFSNPDDKETSIWADPQFGSCTSEFDYCPVPLVRSSALMDPCTDGAMAGTVTTNDPDADGINNVCDLDDDNDGITDNDEMLCGMDISLAVTGGLLSETLTDVLGDVDLTYTISTSASGTYLNNTLDEDLAASGFVGGIDDYLVRFDPDSGQGTSSINIDLTFSEPVYNLSFLITDIDRASTRSDSVIVTSDAGNPTLEIVNTSQNRLSVTGNIVVPTTSINSSNDDLGTVRVSVPDGATSVTIKYEENAGTVDPDGRGIGILGELSFCAELDTDSDGIADHLDLDSDGDGCPDALESDASLDYSELNSDGSINTSTAGYAIDDDGIPGGDDTQSGQPIGTSRDDAQQATECDLCDVNSTLFTDADDDNIGDVCDLDDDNDGITDKDEMLCGTDISLGITGGLLSETLTDVLGDVDLTYTISTSASGAYVGNTLAEDLAASGYAGGIDDYLVFFDPASGQGTSPINIELTFSEPVYNLSFLITDIDRATTRSDLITVSSDIGNPSLEIVNTSQNRLSVTGSVVVPTTSINSSNDDFGTVRVSVPDGATSVTIVYEENAETADPDGRGIGILGELSFCAELDTDSDGIADHLDLDSDGDGCPDALESDASLDYSELNSDGSINTSTAGYAIDDDGIPGGDDTQSGQPIGTSRDDAQQATECDLCDVSSTLFTDADDDNIGDVCDLDDDNDGITDNDEMLCGMDISLAVTGGLLSETLTDVLGDVDLTYTISTSASGTYLNNTLDEDLVASGFVGGIDDYLVRFDPDSGQGTSSINIDLTFSEPVYNLSFLITDIDRASTRSDSVIVTSDAGNPTLEIVNTSQNRLSVTGNIVVPTTSINSSNDDFGTVRVSVPDGATSVTIKYEENAGTVDPDGRGIGILGELSFCAELDTDSDGIADHLDSDSDGDGCPDALESDASLDYSELNSDGSINTSTAGYAIDDDGIPGGDDTQSGQPIGTSRDDAQQATECDLCDVNSTLFTDADDDNIGDVCDLDDDNDGITDKDEMLCGTDISLGITGGLLSETLTDVLGDVDLTYTISTSASGAYVGNTLAEDLAASGYAGGIDDYLVFFDPASGQGTSPINIELTFSEPVYNLSFLITDIDRATTRSDLITVLSDIGNPSLEIVNTSQNRLSVTGSVVVPTTSNNSSNDDFGTVRVSVPDGATSVTIVYEENAETVDPDGRGIGILGELSFCSELDTDGDNIANHLDLDSDGDGCYDSYESGVPGSTNSGSVTDSIVSGLYGDNGLANSIETDDSNNAATTYSSNYNSVALDDTNNACADPCTDGATVGSVTANDPDADGINNACDLDDDNDGITDKDEMLCGTDISLAVTGGLLSETLTDVLGDVDLTYTISTSASGTYLDNTLDEDLAASGFVGGIDDYLVRFDPDSGQGTSSINIDLTFSEPVYNLSFLITDIDRASTRSDSVIVTSDAGNPTLEIVNTSQNRLSVTGNIVVPTTSINSSNDDLGTVRVSVPDGATSVTIKYEENAGTVDPDGRGIGILGELSFCAELDTDGDNMANHLDLDSDGDGCYDSYESGVPGSTNSGSVTDSIVSGPFGDNGLSDNIETDDSESATTSYSSSYSNVALDGNNDACADPCTDGATFGSVTANDPDADGINNVCDLDDDNDGITDKDEMLCGMDISLAVTGGLLSETLTDVLGDVDLTYSISTTASGTFLNNTLDEDLAASGYAGGTDDYLVFFDPDSGQGTSPINIELTFSEPVYNLSFLITDIDRAVTRYDQVTVTSNAGNPALEIVNTSQNRLMLLGNVVVPITSIDSDNDDFGTVRVTVADGATSVTILYEDTGIIDPDARAIGILGELGFCAELDTDGDNIANHLDLDSDGDDCYDSYESGVTGSTNSGSVTDSIVSGPYGDNGLANSVETNDSDNATTTYSSSYDSIALNSVRNACLNAPPVAVDDSTSTSEDTPVIVNVLGNDSDPDGNLVPSTVDTTGLAQPMNGTLTINSTTGEIEYTPDTGFSGTDTYEYQVCDDGTPNLCDTALVTITVGLPNTTMAINDANQIHMDSLAVGNVLVNDLDPQEDAQIVGSIDLDGDGVPETTPMSGTPYDVYADGVLIGVFMINPNTGDYTYQPEQGITDDVSIAMTVCDDNTSVMCDESVLEIIILPLLDTGNTVIARNDENRQEQGSTTTKDLLANDVDLEGDDISVAGAFALDQNGDSLTLTSSPQNIYDDAGNLAGTAYLTSAGEIVYTADNVFVGDVIVEYTTSDDNGASDDARLTIEVTSSNASINDVVANDDYNVATINTDQTGTVIGNDYDPEGNTFTVNNALGADNNNLVVDGTTVNSLPSGGTLVINTDGSYTYSPATDFAGTETIQYVLCDDGSPQACDIAYLYLTSLQSANALPVEWLRFNAILQGNSVLLEWATAIEHNTDVFSIEHSSDGESFEHLTYKKAAGSSNTITEYEFYDRQPFNGINFYRIKQVDLDGAYEYSNIESVLLPITGTEFNMTVFPNPTHSYLNINVSDLDYSLNYTVFNLIGNKVLEGVLSERPLNIQDLPVGSYFLQVANNTQVLGLKKFVVLR